MSSADFNTFDETFQAAAKIEQFLIVRKLSCRKISSTKSYYPRVKSYNYLDSEIKEETHSRIFVLKIKSTYV